MDLYCLSNQKLSVFSINKPSEFKDTGKISCLSEDELVRPVLTHPDGQRGVHISGLTRQNPKYTHLLSYPFIVPFQATVADAVA